MARTFPLLAIACFALAALAGCANNGPTTTTTSEPMAPQQSPLRFNVTEVDHTLDVSEPGIMVDPHGTIWISGPTGFAKTIVRKDPSPLEHDTSLFSSADGGKTWAKVDQVPGYGRDTCPGGGDSDLASAPDGALFLIDLNLANAPVDESLDGGKTWVFNCNSSIEPGIDRQWIAATNDYVWVSVNALTGSPILYRAQRHLVPAEGAPVDTGLVFGPPQNLQVGGAIVVDQATGDLYLAGSGDTVGVSTDAGTTWQYVKTGLHDVDLSASFISIALDKAGDVFVAGAGRDGIVVSGSADHGKTWTPAAKFKPYHTQGKDDKDPTYADAEYGFAWVAAGGNGTVGFSWYGWPSANETGEYKMPAQGYYVFAGVSNDLLQKGADATAVYDRVTEKPITTKRLCQGIAIPTFVQCDQQDPSKTRSLGDFYETAFDNQGRLLITYDDASDNQPPNHLMFAVQTAGPMAAGGWH